MISRQRVAVYIDYAIRLPNFINSYNIFKEGLFSDKDNDVDLEDDINENDVRFFWISQMKDVDVEKFYLNTKLPATDEELCNRSFSEFFYNKEHEDRFIDEFSFNIYSDANVLNPNDIDVINVAQELLFDIVLVDNYRNKRKKSNTLFFLSKARVYPQSILFLGEGQMLNKDNYFAIWNPMVNEEQINKQGDKSFIEWFKELEAKQKKLGNE